MSRVATLDRLFEAAPSSAWKDTVFVPDGLSDTFSKVTERSAVW